MGLYRKLAALALAVAALPALLDFLLAYPGVKVHTRGGVLLTGASTGIGRHAALALDKAGFVVFATVRKEADAQSLRKESTTLQPVIMDVVKSEQIEAAVEAVRKKLEAESLPFVALINNAGVLKNSPIEAQSAADMRFMVSLVCCLVLFG